MPSISFTFAAGDKTAVVNALKGIATESSKTAKKMSAEAERAAKKDQKSWESAAKKIANARIRENERANKAIKRGNEQTVKDMMSAARHIGGAIAGLAVTGAGVAAGVVGAAARDAIKLEERARRVSVNGRQNGQSLRDPGELTRQAYGIASKQGMDAGDVMGGFEKFVAKTGNIQKASEYMSIMATTAKATGSSMEDIGNMTADLVNNNVVKNAEDLKVAMAGFVDQGKKGAMEMKDISQYASKVLASAHALGVNGTKGTMQIGGLMQIARGASGDGAEAATATESAFMHMATHKDQLDKAGVQLYNKDHSLKDPNEIIKDIVTKVGGANPDNKLGAIEKITGREGIRAFAPLIATYKEAYMGASGSDKDKQKAAGEAVAKALEEASSSAATFAEIEKDAATMMGSTSSQLDAAWAKLTGKVSSDLLPSLTALTPQLLALADSATPMVIDAFVDVVAAAIVLGGWIKELGNLISSLPGMGDSKATKNIAALKDKYTEDRDKAQEERTNAINAHDTKATIAAQKKVDEANTKLTNLNKIAMEEKVSDVKDGVRNLFSPMHYIADKAIQNDPSLQYLTGGGTAAQKAQAARDAATGQMTNGLDDQYGGVHKGFIPLDTAKGFSQANPEIFKNGEWQNNGKVSTDAPDALKALGNQLTPLLTNIANNTKSFVNPRDGAK